MKIEKTKNGAPNDQQMVDAREGDGYFFLRV